MGMGTEGSGARPVAGHDVDSVAAERCGGTPGDAAGGRRGRRCFGRATQYYRCVASVVRQAGAGAEPVAGVGTVFVFLLRQDASPARRAPVAPPPGPIVSPLVPLGAVAVDVVVREVAVSRVRRSSVTIATVGGDSFRQATGRRIRGGRS